MLPPILEQQLKLKEFVLDQVREAIYLIDANLCLVYDARMLRASATVARIGGDEFVILLPGLASAEECEFSAQRLLKSIAEPVDIGECRVMLTASIGIALYPGDANDADSLLRHAEEAMYTAKRTGRNQFVYFGNDAWEVTELDGGMVHDLRFALEQDQIEVHYQPIVDLATGHVHKAEALVRWKHPKRGNISPAEFILIAEEAGLIHAIGNRVFQKAVHIAREWNRACPGGALRNISVNRSSREFFGHDGADGWIAHLNTQGVSANMLSLEITESLLLTDHPKVLSQLTQLRTMGMAAAHCDFAQGYLYARPMPEREFLDFVCAAEATPLPVPALLSHVDQN